MKKLQMIKNKGNLIFSYDLFNYRFYSYFHYFFNEFKYLILFEIEIKFDISF